MRQDTNLPGIIARHTSSEISPALATLTAKLREHHGNAIAAILFYGSCLRSGDPFEGLVDLYLLVDDYRSLYGWGGQALANWLLPPNVFYLETKHEGRTLRTKYAVVSLRDFERGTSRRWFHSYLWGRFTQPVAIAYARDPKLEQRVYRCLAQAVLTFVTRVLPHLPSALTASQLWQQGLSLSYQAELRVEKPERSLQLFQAYQSFYNDITAAASQEIPYRVTPDTRQDKTIYLTRIPKSLRSLSRLSWTIRHVQGKMLSILRLLKAFFTFKGGLDYIIWKLERHSGKKIEVPERTRRYPLIFIWGLFWRLYRRGIFR